jgi:TATA-box binding protein (TBP) (component of TFIID and TFIIIB)
VNVKVFKNGRLQMTGLRSPEDGLVVASVVREELRKAALVNSEVMKKQGEDIQISNYRVCMINAMFAVPFSVDRRKTHEVFLRAGVQSIYDPMLYHAVKLRVERPPLTSPAKKTKKTCATVAIFQTGSVIITGATTIEEVRYVYELVKDTLLKNQKMVQRIEWRILPQKHAITHAPHVEIQE